MKFLNTRSRSFASDVTPLLNRFALATDRRITGAVEKIVKSVEKDGDKALFKWTKKFDGLDLSSKTIRLDDSRIKDAYAGLSAGLRKSIKAAFRNVKEFHSRQMEKSWSIKKGTSRVGQLIRPIGRVGLYVPGGTASYPSSVIMNAVPALVAGVREIIICSPAPGGKMNPAVLYAASLCGIREFYTVGGAQAIAAMAYGTESIKPVYKIVGPGNAYVAEAKRMVFGKVDIDMVAGPSEICIVADDTANPAWCAADILSQAEHDENAWPVFVSPSEKLCKSVISEVERQVAILDRRTIAEKCLKSRFYVILTSTIDEAVGVANEIAPEHLELAFKGASGKIGEIENAGAVFVGHYSPEVLGDYMAGPNHVLPTAGSARFFSPLGVYDFIKRSSLIEYSKKDFLKVADSVAMLADSEGLTAHARSARIRNS